MSLIDTKIKVKSQERFEVMILFDKTGADGLALELAIHLGNEIRNAKMSAFHVEMVNSTTAIARQNTFYNLVGTANAFVSG